MLYIKIDENGVYQELYSYKEPPMVEVEGELIPDETFVSVPVPNNVFMELGVSPKWTGSEWIATAEPPEPPEYEPSTDEQMMLAIAELDMQRATDRLETEMSIAELAETILGGF